MFEPDNESCSSAHERKAGPAPERSGGEPDLSIYAFSARGGAAAPDAAPPAAQLGEAAQIEAPVAAVRPSERGGILGIGRGIALRAGNLASRAAAAGLDWIAADPRAQASLGRAIGALGIDLVPFLGPLKKYADARAMYKENDPLLESEAKKLFVIACAEAAFDTVTLGGSAFVPDEALTYLRTARDLHRRARAVTSSSGLIPDPLTLAAGLILKIPGCDWLADRALRFATNSSAPCGDQPQKG